MPSRAAPVRSTLIATLGGATVACGATAPAAFAVAPPTTLTCAHEAHANVVVKEERDAILGPLALMGLRRSPDHGRRGAFNGHGWKSPALLRPEIGATLSVPARLRGRVGFVYSQDVQARVWRDGPSRASAVVVFPACPRSPGTRGLGWPGGVVADRPRCAVMLLKVEGESGVTRHRVPLGRRCA